MGKTTTHIELHKTGTTFLQRRCFSAFKNSSYLNFAPESQKRFKEGIIPHYVVKDLEIVENNRSFF